MINATAFSSIQAPAPPSLPQRVLLASTCEMTRIRLSDALSTRRLEAHAAVRAEEVRAAAGVPRLRCIVLVGEPPDSCAVTLCLQLRLAAVRAPILVSMNGLDGDRRTALYRVGADRVLDGADPEHTAAHALAMIRRAAGLTSDACRCGPFLIDRARRRVTVQGVRLALSRSEVDLLEYLCRCDDTVVSFDELVGELHDRVPNSRDRASMRRRVSRLKTDLGSYGDLIESVRGTGCRLRAS